MTVGLSTTNLANVWLDELDVKASHAKLHTNVGEPGAAGTSNPSSVTTRMPITWSAAAAGVKAMSGTLSWTAWAGSSETLAYLSTWSNITAGNFCFSVAFTTPRAVVAGDTLTVTSLSVSQAPLAT